MELWDVYDKNRKPKGYKIMRGGDRRLGHGEYHITVHVCVFSSDGRMLIQKRAASKGLWGGLWDISAGGSVLAGEMSSDGAKRELSEELGIDAVFSGTTPGMTLYNKDCISDYYMITLDVDTNTLNVPNDEVSDARYATLDEVLDMIQAKEFVPYRESVVRILFEMREHSGAW